ncbi:SAM-dependent methyltransferase [Actinoallomurus vinaceus]|uniref:SAM-dependent methyltransferase n=1 Tax=Actinoallomurus vinaceus TaxID=1080074 RepID=A0ABP8UA52_9ACTN
MTTHRARGRVKLSIPRFRIAKDSAIADREPLPKDIDPTAPNDARMYDYALGGKDNYSADRHVSEQIRAALPVAINAVRENRKFMRRAVRYMLSLGIRQFLDLGCGLPGRGNVHEIVHGADPEATVVYVDKDPVPVTHFQALLSSSRTATAVQADIRRPNEILSGRDVTSLIDFSRPVGVLMVAVLHYVFDEDDPAGIVTAFSDALSPGSHLAICHFTSEGWGPEDLAFLNGLAESAGVPVALRDRKQIAALLGGLDLIEPGLVLPPHWRPDRPLTDPSGWLLAGMCRKN